MSTNEFSKLRNYEPPDPEVIKAILQEKHPDVRGYNIAQITRIQNSYGSIWNYLFQRGNKHVNK